MLAQGQTNMKTYYVKGQTWEGNEFGLEVDADTAESARKTVERVIYAGSHVYEIIERKKI